VGEQIMTATDSNDFLAQIPRVGTEGHEKCVTIVLEGIQDANITAFCDRILPQTPPHRIVKVSMETQSSDDFYSLAYPKKDKLKNGNVIAEEALPEASIGSLLEENIGDDYGVLFLDNVDPYEPAMLTALLDFVQNGAIGKSRIGKNVLTFLNAKGTDVSDWPNPLLNRCLRINLDN
jgi:MoxR-like ATPase